MTKRVFIMAILLALLLTGCSYAGYHVKTFVGTTEPDNPQHRLVTIDDFKGLREAKYDFKSGLSITIELQATKGSLDFELRSPSGQSMGTLSSSGQTIIQTMDGQFAAGSYTLIFKSQQVSSGYVKVFMD